MMTNRNMYKWMRKLADSTDFVECVALTDRALDEHYDLELILRFLVFRTVDEKQLSRIGDLGDFLTENLTEMARNEDFDFEEAELAFSTAFSLLRRTTGSNSFKKYDKAKSEFVGGFLVSAYEVIAIGLGFNYLEAVQANLDIKTLIQGAWSKEALASISGPGIRTSSRLPNTVLLGRELFKT
jgi:hypothetical protein